MKINFYNNWHCGDIHNSRILIKKIMCQLGTDKTYTYSHINGNRLLLDVPNLTYINQSLNTNDLVFKHQDELYINTWVGCADKNNLRFCSYGCNALGTMHLLNEIFEKIEINHKITDEWEMVVDDIDYTKYSIKSIDQFFEDHTNKIVILCNGDTLSGQSVNFSFDSIINELCKIYPHVSFILTAQTNIKHDNLFYTKDIIGNVDGRDLNEIGYLGHRANIIIGRSSGPSTFLQTKDTLSDENKTFLMFNHTINDAFFSLLGNSKKIHSNNYKESSVLEKILIEMESI